MSEVFSASFLGNTPLQWAIAAMVTAFSAVALATMFRVARARMTAWARTTEGQLDDVVADTLHATKLFFIVAVALLLGAKALTLSTQFERLIDKAFVLAVIVQAGLWAHAGIGGWLRGHIERNRATNATGATTSSVLGFIARVALWSLVLLLVLENLGVDITALVASLGIGGIAVALAVQNILGDVFASLAIALDQPVVIGDFIVIGEVMGTVERVGLKTTHLRSLSGELIVVANSDLLNSRIRNYKRMFQRRILFGFGVTYETPPEKLRRIPEMVREIVQSESLARFDRAHLARFGASALEYEVVYFVTDPDYNKYMDVQETINLRLIEALQAVSVEFAYPTQTIHIASPAAPTP
ncbi:MAG: mechanosensitive ion channel family protein [Gammaproteobacteria bacterium]|nr:mechanosensitive ion channel family protein [Gammaproteobacteria bacterium]